MRDRASFGRSIYSYELCSHETVYMTWFDVTINKHLNTSKTVKPCSRVASDERILSRVQSKGLLIVGGVANMCSVDLHAYLR